MGDDIGGGEGELDDIALECLVVWSFTTANTCVGGDRKVGREEDRNGVVLEGGGGEHAHLLVSLRINSEVLILFSVSIVFKVAVWHSWVATIRRLHHMSDLVRFLWRTNVRSLG